WTAARRAAGRRVGAALWAPCGLVARLASLHQGIQSVALDAQPVALGVGRDPAVEACLQRRPCLVRVGCRRLDVLVARTPRDRAKDLLEPAGYPEALVFECFEFGIGHPGYRRKPAVRAHVSAPQQ